MKLNLNIGNLFKKKETTRKVVNIKVENDAKIARTRGKDVHQFGGANDRNTQAIYIPQKKKLKGYQKSKIK